MIHYYRTHKKQNNMLRFLENLNQIGGAKMAKSSGKFPWAAFLLSILLIIIRALLVQWSYNLVMPKVFVSMGGNPQAFRELTLTDAIILSILTSALF